MFDPFLSFVSCPINKLLNIFGKDYLSCLKREKTLEKCEEKLSEELDILNLLKKIRQSNSILNFLLTKRQKMYLKYNEQKVVDIESSDSEISISGTSSGLSSPDEENFYANKYDL